MLKECRITLISGFFAQLLISLILTHSSSAFAGLFDEAVSGQLPLSGSENEPSNSETTQISEKAANENEADETTSPISENDKNQTEKEESPESSSRVIVERIIERSGLAFDLNGHLKGSLFVGKMPDYSRVEIKSGYGEMGLKLKVSKSPFGDAFGEVRFQGGYLNDKTYLGQRTEGAVSEEDMGKFQTRIKLREAYVNAYIGKHLDFRFGYQIIVWGRADGINPTNNLTPIDMRVRSSEEDDRRLGNLALRANLKFSPICIEAVWVPLFAPSYMPKINLADSIVFENPKYPTTDISKGTYAAKLHLLLSKVEMSFSYLYGYSPLPSLSFTSHNLLDDPREGSAQIKVARTAFQHHVAGFDFSTVIAGKVGLRGEMAFKYPVDFKEQEPPYTDEIKKQVAVPNPELYYVLGFDKEIKSVHLIAQYVGKSILKWKDLADSPIDVNLNNLDETLSNSVGYANEAGIAFMIHRELTLKNRIIQGQPEQFQHGVFMRLEWKTLHETLSLSATGMFNASTLEWMLYPKLAYSITDAMWLTVGGEIYQGPSDTLFGYVEEILSAGYTELKVAF